MTIESKQYAEFESFEKITKPEELSLIREKISSSPSLTGTIIMFTTFDFKLLYYLF